MVDIKRTIILLAVALFALESSAQSTLGTFAQRQTKQLERRKEQINKQLQSAQEAFTKAPCDSLNMVIYELTQQVGAVEKALERIALEEQERIRKEQEEAARAAELAAQAEEAARAAELAAQQAEEAARLAELATQEATKADSIALASQGPVVVEQEGNANWSSDEATTQGEVVVEEQTAPAVEETNTPLARFSTALGNFALMESEIGVLIEQYKEAHRTATDAQLAYSGATSLKSAQEQLNTYKEATATLKSLATDIALKSDQLFESKLETYISLAEEVGANHMREKYSNIIRSIDSKHVGKLKDRCSDVDVAMYPYRLRGTIELEIEVAELLGCEGAAPLKQTLENFNPNYALFAKVRTPAYAEANYAAAKIDKKKAYVPISSLPKIEIPAEGEVFSIQVAAYSKLPNSTSVFHNATPLYRETRSDGLTYIYVGLYPTAKSATDDITKLKNAGFKKPTLVSWRNGVRRDDSAAKGNNANTVTYYRIEINGVDSALNPTVLQAIRQTAPGKEISKFNAADGTLVYSVGNFKKESEARALASAITSADASLSVTVVEFERKK